MQSCIRRRRLSPDRIKNICVYCGSSPGNRDEYKATATALADALVSRDIGLVYGGSSRGIMGVLADAMLKRGGQVRGVMPDSLVQKEIAHNGLTELHVTHSMHERKSMMAELSDGFIALPGGFGTLEEIIEMLTWAQLRFHEKPCGLLNVADYYDHLLSFIRHAEAEGFLHTMHREMLMVSDTPLDLLKQFDDYVPPRVEKWR